MAIGMIGMIGVATTRQLKVSLRYLPFYTNVVEIEIHRKQISNY